MSMLLLSIGQLAFGFVVAIVLLAIAKSTAHFVGKAFDRLADPEPLFTRRPAFQSNVATIPSDGYWQYNTSFFDKVTEFRNDFV